MQPAGEDLDGDRRRAIWPDRLQILIGDPFNCLGQRGIEDIEVAHPTLAAQLVTLDDHLEAVVVGVQLSFWTRSSRHHVPGPDFGDRSDGEHASSVAQGGVDQPVRALVDSRKGVGGVVEGERVGGERRQWQLA